MSLNLLEIMFEGRIAENILYKAPDITSEYKRLELL